MRTLDRVEESVGRSIGSVGKAVGDPLENCGKVLENCRNLPVERKSVSVRFPVRGHIYDMEHDSRCERHSFCLKMF